MPPESPETLQFLRPDSSYAPGTKDYAVASAVFLLFSSICLTIDSRLRMLATDDSFIHLRIARHLIDTGHAFFNLNERVMVTSSPVWTIALALSSLLFHKIPPALPLECLSTGLACSLCFLLAAQVQSQALSKPIVRYLYLLALPTLVFLILLQSTIGEMETPLAISFMLAGCYSFERRWASWLSLLTMAAFTRYEYGVLVLCFLVLAAVKRRVSLRSAVFGLITVVAAVSWLLYQYGTIIPNTLKAKAAGYVVSAAATAEAFGLGIGKPKLVIRLLLMVAVVVAVATRRSARQFMTPTVLVLLGAALDALYILKRTFIFPWYLPLTVVPFEIGLMLGAVTAHRKWERWVAVAAALVFLNMPLRSAEMEIVAGVTHQPWRDLTNVFNSRAEEYRAVGTAINNTCPHARLLSSEIGGLGDAFHGEILDGFGLATPEAIKYHQVRGPEGRSLTVNGAIPIGFVQEMRPDVIVSYDFLAEDLLHRYDPSVYAHFVYPTLPASEMGRYDSWSHAQLHILVAKHGACSAKDIDQAVKASMASR